VTQATTHIAGRPFFFSFLPEKSNRLFTVKISILRELRSSRTVFLFFGAPIGKLIAHAYTHKDFILFLNVHFVSVLIDDFLICNFSGMKRRPKGCQNDDSLDDDGSKNRQKYGTQFQIVSRVYVGADQRGIAEIGTARIISVLRQTTPMRVVTNVSGSGSVREGRIIVVASYVFHGKGHYRDDDHDGRDDGPEIEDAMIGFDVFRQGQKVQKQQYPKQKGDRRKEDIVRIPQEGVLVGTNRPGNVENAAAV
jgi:hypothetical protein